MNDTALNLGFGIYRAYCLTKSYKTVYAKDVNRLNTAVFKVIEHISITGVYRTGDLIYIITDAPELIRNIICTVYNCDLFFQGTVTQILTNKSV